MGSVLIYRQAEVAHSELFLIINMHMSLNINIKKYTNVYIIQYLYNVHEQVHEHLHEHIHQHVHSHEHKCKREHVPRT